MRVSGHEGIGVIIGVNFKDLLVQNPYSGQVRVPLQNLPVHGRVIIYPVHGIAP